MDRFRRRVVFSSGALCELYEDLRSAPPGVSAAADDVDRLLPNDNDALPKKEPTTLFALFASPKTSPAWSRGTGAVSYTHLTLPTIPLV